MAGHGSWYRRTAKIALRRTSIEASAQVLRIMAHSLQLLGSKAAIQVGLATGNHVASHRTKIAFIAGIVLVLALAAVVLGANFLVSRQDHELIRQQIAARLETSTGLELEIEGPLELPYSLLPTVVFHHVVLSNPAVETERSLLIAKDLRVTIEILPLLRGEVLVHKVSLSSVELNLEVDEDGNANWTSEAAGATLPTQIEIHSIEVNNISLSYRNLQSGFIFGSYVDRLTVAARRSHDPVEVTLSTGHYGPPISIRGRIGSTEEILAGRAFSIDLSLDVQGVAIEVTGQFDRIEEGEIPELHLRADGDNLGDLGGLLGTPLPETDDFSLATRLTTVDGAISASEIAVEIDWRDSHLMIRGDVQDVGAWSGLNLITRVSGDDLSDISHLHELASVPQTGSYVFSGEVRGDWPSVGVHDADLSVWHDDKTLVASGRIDDLATKRGIDVALDVWGEDLADLSPFVEWTLPPTDTFHLSGTLRGSWPALTVTQATASLSRDKLIIKMTGDIENLADLTGIDFDVVASGADLASVPELSPLEPPATDRFKFKGRLTGSASRLSVTELDSTFERGQHRVTLSGDVDDIAAFGGINWQFTAAGTDLSELNEILALDFPPTQSYRASAALSGDASILSARDVVIEGAAPGIRLGLRGIVGRIFELQDLDLEMLIAIDDLSRLNPYLETDIPKSEQFEVSGRLTGTAPNLNLEKFTVRSGRTLVKGSVALQTGERAGILGSVSSGLLDLRPYLIAAREEAGAHAASRNDRVFSDQPFDFRYLDTLDVDLTLDNIEVVLPASNLIIDKATVKLQQGAVNIAPMELIRGDSTISGNFRLDRKATPEFHADLSIENVDLRNFLQDLRIREIYEGRFDLAVNLRSRGNSVRQVMANLDGEIAAFVSEARVPSVSLSLRSIDIILGMLPWIKRREVLIVNCAISQLDIDDGIVDIKLLYLDSAQMRMVGGGTIDLGGEELNLRLAPRARRSRILAHNIDLLVTGSLANPKISSVGAGKAIATDYGKYALLGPLGLLVPTGRSRKHPCVGSLQEYRQQQAAED